VSESEDTVDFNDPCVGLFGAHDVALFSCFDRGVILRLNFGARSA